MDNQYNYYDPNKEDKNNIFDEQPQGMNGGQTGMNGQLPKKHHKCPRWAKLAGSAVAFGVIASCTFMGVNAVAGKYFGTNTTQQTSSSKATTSKNSDSSSTLKLSQSSSTVTSDVSDIVNNAMPSVVAITNMSVQEVQSYFGGTQQQESTSCGSGIIIGKNDSELLIVTNNHVVEGAETLTVSFANETSVEASIKGTDSSKDLAVVALDSIDDDTMNAISIITLGDSDKLQVGEPVIAIGNALGYGQSVTTGIVSALDRNLDMEGFDSKLIQTDAAINPGNSGGALLNANGELIGINTAKVNANAVEGMGYAIPISDATSVIENLMNRETRTKVDESEQGFLGIEGYDVTSEKAEMYSIPTGVFVRSVEDGSAADKAGITAECIITKFDGITIDSMSTLQSQMQYFKAGDKVEVVIEVPNKSGTKYEEKTVTVTLGERSK